MKQLKYCVVARKQTTGKDGWLENKVTFQLDTAANQFSLIKTDGEGSELFLFDTYKDAAAACRAVNKSLVYA